MNIFRRRGTARRKPPARKATFAARLAVERLEGRDLLSTVPLPPTGVVARGDSASAITLTWNASTDPTVTGYDVYEKTHVGGGHNGGGHDVYTLLAGNLNTTSYTITGLGTGSRHDYVVTDVNSAGQSLYSYVTFGQTWSAPALQYGTTYYQLSSGYEASGPVNATVGLTTELTFYVGGNPLTYSIVSGPSTASIDPKLGIMKYKPAATEVGTVNVEYQASNALGSVTQTISFDVAAANSSLAKPTLKLSGLTATYNGQLQSVSATAYAKDGVTPVSGSYEFAFDGSATTPPDFAGTYQVLVTFTSADSNYSNATVTTHITVNQAKPAFSYLSSPSIALGAATTTLSGTLAAGSVFPTPDYVIITLNGVSEAAPLNIYGHFSTAFDTSALAAGKYSVVYAYAGDSNFKAATNGSSTLTVGAPMVTQNPSNVTTTAGNLVTFTAAATGSSPMTVKWQVSTNGGATFTYISGNASAQTTTLSFYANVSENGYLYRAVFTNSIGKATTSFATLYVDD
jgi:hypothetical protein